MRAWPPARSTRPTSSACSPGCCGYDPRPWTDRSTAFRLEARPAQLGDLRERLRRTRWPEHETAPGWAQGVPVGWVEDLCRYWAEEYGWARRAELLNRLPQFRTRIDGLDFLFAAQGHDWGTSVSADGDLYSVFTRDELLDNLFVGEARAAFRPLR